MSINPGVKAASILRRFETPGRPMGSYVMVGIESVTAERIFLKMEDGESVSMMREVGSGADLDIFWVGSRRERIRGEGAIHNIKIYIVRRKCGEDSYCRLLEGGERMA